MTKERKESGQNHQDHEARLMRLVVRKCEGDDARQVTTFTDAGRQIEWNAQEFDSPENPFLEGAQKYVLVRTK